MDISSEASLYNENLFKPDNSKYLDYLQVERGLKMETINSHNLGVDAQGNITIPIPDPVTPVGIKKRTDPFNPGTNKYLNPSGVQSLIFNEMTLSRDGIEEVVLCEGELDALTLEQYDIPAITKTTGGGSSFKAEEIQKIIDCNPKLTIYFGLDTDEAGKKWMLNYATTYKDNGRIKFVEVPNGKDWNEVVVKLQKQNYSQDKIKYTLRDVLIKAASAQAYLAKYGIEARKELISLINLADAPDEKLEFLAKPIVIKNGINLLAGAAGSFKSFLSLDLAISCIQGKLFLGICETVAIKKVILFDLENPPARIRERIVQLGGNVNDFMILEHPYYFDKEENIKQKLFDTISLYPDSLLVIDSFRRANIKLDENSSEDVNEFFEKINELKKISTILILHHTTKYAEQDKPGTYRGSGDFLAAVDSAITVKKAASNGHMVRLEIYHTKARFSGTSERIIAEYTISPDSTYVDAHYDKEKVVDPIAQQASLEMFIEGKGELGCSTEDIQHFGTTALKIGEHKVNDLRKNLEYDEKVIAIKNFNGKKTYYFHKDFAPQQFNP
jgi:hypothetical protein